MRLMNRTINSAKNMFVVKNQLQTQNFFQSSFSIKKFKKTSEYTIGRESGQLKLNFLSYLFSAKR